MRTAWIMVAAAMSAIGGGATATDNRAGETCINDTTLATPVPQKDGTIFFRGEPSHNQSYIGTFKGGRCPGMHNGSTLIIERDGGRYCEGDKVRAIDPPQTIPGPVCILDRFLPAPAQVRAPRR